MDQNYILYKQRNICFWKSDCWSGPWTRTSSFLKLHRGPKAEARRDDVNAASIHHICISIVWYLLVSHFICYFIGLLTCNCIFDFKLVNLKLHNLGVLDVILSFPMYWISKRRLVACILVFSSGDYFVKTICS